VRKLEQDIAGLTYTSPLTGRGTTLTHFLADPVEEKILHYVSADPARVPTMTMFAGESEFVFGGSVNCGASCVSEPPAFAWNHGGIEPDMTRIWLGLVGPGVRRLGIDTSTWADQTDLRPTVLALARLRDDYPVDGRVLTEDLSRDAVPAALHSDQLTSLGSVYKQLLAGPGEFGVATLTASTRALSSSDQTQYAAIEDQLTALGNARDALTARIRSVLLGATFDHQRPDPGSVHRLIGQGRALLAAARALARG
jgi:hypothetical protein